MADSVIITNAALDELPSGKIVLRGVIAPQSFHSLQTGDYQREILSRSSINQLVRAFVEGSVPDVELGMRGEEFCDASIADAVSLGDPVFIIDGLQRISAARQMIETGHSVTPHLGAMIHFGTSEEWERDRFRILNMDRSKLSPNVLIRNWRHDYDVIEMLYNNSITNRSFSMCGRIGWQQRMGRGELITATTFVKVAGRLHGHMGTSMGSSQIAELTPALQRVMTHIGKHVFRDNVVTFFEVIDSAYGIKRVTYKEGAVYLKANFLYTLARIFSEHENFWKGNRLQVDTPTIKKLSNFAVRDPHVISLSAASGTAGAVLYQMMVEHINSGRRVNRLRSRHSILSTSIDEDMDEVDTDN